MSIPVAIAVALGVRVVVFYINRYTLSQIVPFYMAEYLGPESLIGAGFIDFFSDFGMGAAFIYVATSIAPTHKRSVAIVLGATVSLLAVARSVFLLVNGDNWGAFNYVCGAGGAVFCAAFRLVEYGNANLHQRQEA